MTLTQDASGRWRLETQGELIGYDGENMAHELCIRANTPEELDYYAELEYADGDKAVIPLIYAAGALMSSLPGSYLNPGTAVMQIRAVVGEEIKKSNLDVVVIGRSINATDELDPPEQSLWDVYAAQVAQLRDEAQDAAERAETAAGNNPVIGDNGNWHIWDAEKEAYIDSGVYAGGEAPHIGDNGNWFVGENDTGVSANGKPGPQGPPGKDGTSLTIKGRYDTLEQLRAAHPIGTTGDAYAVGTVSENIVYVWSEDLMDWDPVGALQGAPGEDGKDGQDGENGVGIASVEQITTSTEDGGTNLVRLTLTNGAYVDIEVRNGTKGSQGEKGATGKTGSTGAPGVGVDSMVQRTESLVDSGKNEFRFTLTDGTYKDFAVRNGSRGSTGPAPVRGTDYWTEADKAAIVEDVLEQLPSASGAQTLTVQASITRLETYVSVPFEPKAAVFQTEAGSNYGRMLGMYDAVSGMFTAYDAQNAKVYYRTASWSGGSFHIIRGDGWELSTVKAYITFIG